MPGKRNLGFPIILGLVMAAILAIGGGLVIYQANKSKSDIPKLWQVPPFEFVDSGDRPFGLEDMKGKINVVDFIFTNCTSICPVMSAKMSDLYKLYSGYDFVQFVSITVDPERDSLAALQQYAESWDVDDDRWVFLWAPVDEMVNLMEGGFKLPAGDLPMGHSNKFVLVDKDGYIRGYFDSFDDGAIAAMKDDIKEMSKGFK